MDDQRLAKRLFYGDVTTGSRSQGGQVRRHKDTLKTSPRGLQIDPADWADLARDRPTWRRTVKTSAGIYGANRITAAEVKRNHPDDANRCSAVHLCLAPKPPINTDSTPEPPLSSSSVALTSPTAALAPTATANNPDSPTNVHLTTANPGDVDSVHICPHCDRTFTSHISLVTCESTAQRLAEQCLEHPHILIASASTVHMALANSLIECVFQVTRVFMRAEFTAASENLAHPAHLSCLAQPAPRLLARQPPAAPPPPKSLRPTPTPLIFSVHTVCVHSSHRTAQRLAHLCLRH
nr:unnamed protein product [Spirometra erinaceieuropaei]